MTTIEQLLSELLAHHPHRHADDQRAAIATQRVIDRVLRDRRRRERRRPRSHAKLAA